MLKILKPGFFGTPDEGPPPTWKNAKKALEGGHIAIVALSDGRLLLVDEEAELKGLPVNDYASEVAATRVRGIPPLLGVAVIVELDDIGSVLGSGGALN